MRLELSVTDKELDKARIEEAWRIWTDPKTLAMPTEVRMVAGEVARLARENWTPDPLDVEVERLMGWEPPTGMVNTVWVRDQFRKALERGIEIGRDHG